MLNPGIWQQRKNKEKDDRVIRSPRWEEWKQAIGSYESNETAQLSQKEILLGDGLVLSVGESLYAKCLYRYRYNPTSPTAPIHFEFEPQGIKRVPCTFPLARTRPFWRGLSLRLLLLEELYMIPILLIWKYALRRPHAYTGSSRVESQY